MILEDNNKEISESSQISSVSNPKSTPKKNLFQIESPQVPLDLNTTQKIPTFTFNHINKLNFSTVNQFEFKPKFSIIPNNNNLIPSIQNLPPFKFVTNKEQNTPIVQNNIEPDLKDEGNNQEIKKIKEMKLKRKKLKKFKIYHIEFKKLSEKDRFLNKQMHKRKYKPDDIRKKIKARFHKSIKNIINDNLRKAGSKKLFTYLPQVFISSITKEKNRSVLNLSFREILQNLDDNPEICQNSGFDIISNMKYADLLDEYFKSEEFEKAICKLREENEDEEYIKEYIMKSKSYLHFFMDIPFKLRNNKFKIEERKQKNNDSV